MYIVVRYIAIALLDLSLNGRSFAFHLANIDPKKLDGGTFTSSSFLFLSLFRRVVQLSSSDPGRADTTTVLQPPPTVAHCCLKTT